MLDFQNKAKSLVKVGQNLHQVEFSSGLLSHEIDPRGQFHESKLSINSLEVEQNLLWEKKKQGRTFI